MSEEKVEILRRAVEAFDRGAEDEWIAAWHPDAELYDFTDSPTSLSLTADVKAFGAGPPTCEACSATFA